jgi:MFS family permease
MNRANASASLIITANFLQSISVGINAVIFTTALSSYGVSTSLIGVILAVEYLSVFGISFGMARMLRTFSLPSLLEISTLFRVPALIALMYVDTPAPWLVFVFLHGIGNFMFGIFLQTWINSLKFGEHQGLFMGLFGTSISLGLALGPLLLSFFDAHPQLALDARTWLQTSINAHLNIAINPRVSDATIIGLLLSAVLSLIAAIPTLMGRSLAPFLEINRDTSMRRLIGKSPAAFFAVMLCGFSILGLQSFITLYGVQNGMSVVQASYLLSAFMLGSIVLEAPIASLSDRFDRRYVMIVLVLLGLVAAIYLPIAIYWEWIARALLFVWGGMMGAIFSICLALISERFDGDELVTANGTFSVMDNCGGLLGVLVLGAAMDVFGADGFPYALMLASAVYFSYALTRYQIR